MLHPLELMSLVVGQQAIDWSHLEKVSYSIYTLLLEALTPCAHVSTVATRLYSPSWVIGLTKNSRLFFSHGKNMGCECFF